MFKKMEKDSFYYGFPVVLMTTKDTENNKDNITVISSTWTLGKSIVIGLGLANKGYLNLQVGSEATFNVADATIWENMNASQKQQVTLICLTLRNKLAMNIVQINLVWVDLRKWLEKKFSLLEFKNVRFK